jgi:hypothetical protein
MRCLNCGHENDRVWYEPLRQPLRPYLREGATPAREKAYRRWACAKCRRYHFPDGSLYKNPFPETAEALTEHSGDPLAE